MKGSSSGTPAYLRNLNEWTLLERIIADGPLSRAELSRRTGLSKPTVSSAILQLIERGLVRETGRGDNSQGRKSTLLEFNRTCYYVLGIDLGATRIRTALGDLEGQLCGFRQTPMPKEGMQGAELQALILAEAEALLLEQGMTWRSIQAATIGIPGIVDTASGEVSQLVPPLPGAEQSLSRAQLNALLPVRVETENDVNLAALAEFTIQGGAESGPLLYFSLGEGTGGGLVLNGAIFHGFRGAAGEFANMTLHGERVEEVLSAGGLMRLAARFGGEAGEREGRSLKEPGVSPERLIEQARGGDAAAMAVMDAYCELLAEALINLCAVIAPETVVLGGGIGRNADVLLPRLERRLSGFYSRPCLDVTRHQEKDVVLGAIQTAVQAALRHIREAYQSSSPSNN
ncbi:ROK family transcriptional regulator [Paenibacillus sp. HN-1]|uniref:ROK family transcriptional regulator n=1 Tax=Paenibacillus TaxID=44249 RepID=UPI001CA7FDAD|nr:MULTISPECIES: ROK family transcriptional regulator [Paenibacillus]MBY9080601.1 ROK family transcriptional regulator [Paenibacillus sp. CGMCC 1.18879]MBY9085454.1 ROK family transcriptional regulator [Paenibacillus sinensis]